MPGRNDAPGSVSSPRTVTPSEFAAHVLRYNLQVKPGEHVTIEAWTHTLPWAAALAREVRRLKAFPLVIYEDEAGFWDSVDSKEEKILGAAPAHEWALLGKTDVYIHMWNAGDRLRMDALPRARVEKIFAFNPAWYAAGKKAGLRGSRLEVGRPFPNLAKVYGVDEEAWRNTVAAATMVDPKRLEATGKPIALALERGKRIRIHDDQGTDLTLGLAKRRARVDAGRHTKEDLKGLFSILNLLPPGAVRVALDEKVAEGRIVANRTSYNDIGMATGGMFEFRGGRLVDHHYDTGNEFFDKDYAKGGKGRDQPGYLAIGLNPRLHNTPQLEDREAGAITVTIGNNEFVPGGRNKAKFGAIVVNVGATVEIDGKRLPLPG